MKETSLRTQFFLLVFTTLSLSYTLPPFSSGLYHANTTDSIFVVGPAPDNFRESLQDIDDSNIDSIFNSLSVFDSIRMDATENSHPQREGSIGDFGFKAVVKMLFDDSGVYIFAKVNDNNWIYDSLNALSLYRDFLCFRFDPVLPSQWAYLDAITDLLYQQYSWAASMGTSWLFSRMTPAEGQKPGVLFYYDELWFSPDYITLPHDSYPDISPMLYVTPNARYAYWFCTWNFITYDRLSTPLQRANAYNQCGFSVSYYDVSAESDTFPVTYSWRNADPFPSIDTSTLNGISKSGIHSWGTIKFIETDIGIKNGKTGPNSARFSHAYTSAHFDLQGRMLKPNYKKGAIASFTSQIGRIIMH